MPRFTVNNALLTEAWHSDRPAAHIAKSFGISETTLGVLWRRLKDSGRLPNIHRTNRVNFPRAIRVGPRPPRQINSLGREIDDTRLQPIDMFDGRPRISSRDPLLDRLIKVHKSPRVE